MTDFNNTPSWLNPSGDPYQDLKRYQSYLDEGVRYYNAGNLERALKCFEKAIGVKPEGHEAWFNKGNALINLGKNEEAIAAYDEVIKIQPEDCDAWFNKGNALINLGENEKAIAAYERALELKPDDYGAWNNKGIALSSLGENEKALAAYEKVIEIKRDDYEAWEDKGNLLYNLKRHEEAIAAYDEAIKIQPEDYDAWFNKGNALGNLCRYNEAIAAYDEAIKIQPEDCDAWFCKGCVLINLEKSEEALAAYDEVIKIQPEDCNAWLYKGGLLYSLHKSEEALAAYEKVLEIKPEDDGARKKKGYVLINLEKYEEALAAYDKVIKIKPEDHEAWLIKGNILSILDRYSEANATYDRAVEIKQDLYNAWERKGWALRELGRYNEALAAYDKAIEIKTDEALNNKSIVLRDLGRYEEAIAACDKVLEIEPDCYYAWGNKGITLNKLGRYEEALENFNKAEKLTQKPDEQPNWEIWQHRGWTIYELQGYHAAIEHWNQGLEYFPSDTRYHQEGRGVLHWQIAKASDRYAQQQADSKSLLHQATSSYEQSLKFLTEEDFPQKNLEVLQELIPVFQKLGKIGEANGLSNKGIALLGKLVQQAADSARKTELSRKFAGFNQRGVDQLAFSPYRQTQALELAEKHKNLCLEWLKCSFVESSDGNVSSPKYREIQTLLDSKTAALYWHLSPAAITVFLLRHNKPPQIIRKNQPLSVWLPDLRELWQPTPAAYLAAREQLEEFQKWMKRWRENYEIHCQEQKQKPSNNSQWREGVEEELKKLGEILDSDGLLRLLKDCDRLILIPHRELHLLPLHYLFDELKVSYLPSAKVGLEIASLHSAAVPMTEGVERLLSIEHPSDFMPYAAVESAFIGKEFSTRCLAGDDATVEELEKQLETPRAVSFP